MDDMEQKLNAVLNNPEMMGKILSMAQSLGSGENRNLPESLPDPGMLKQLTGLSGTDPQQKALLQALAPYVSGSRLRKLEKAMRAAKMARLASTFLGNGKLFAGR